MTAVSSGVHPYSVTWLIGAPASSSSWADSRSPSRAAKHERCQPTAAAADEAGDDDFAVVIRIGVRLCARLPARPHGRDLARQHYLQAAWPHPEPRVLQPGPRQPEPPGLVRVQALRRGLRGLTVLAAQELLLPHPRAPVLVSANHQAQCLAETSLTADLGAGLLIEVELLVVRDTCGGRTSPAILRQKNGALVHPVRHVVARQARAAGLRARIGAGGEEDFHGLRMLLFDRPHQRRRAANRLAHVDVCAGFDAAP